MSAVVDAARSTQMRVPGRGHGAKWTRRREVAISSLLECDTIIEAAQRANLNPSTMRRWLRDPRFVDEYAAAKRRLLDSAIIRLRRFAGTAVDVLQAVATDGKAPHAARTTAAARLLDAALKAAQLEDLQGRVDAIERELRTWKK